ncbi:MAG: PQQ-dependent sugar dehydrogenase [Pseudomonadota bacterium]
MRKLSGLVALVILSHFYGPAHSAPGLTSPAPVGPFLDGAFPSTTPGSAQGDWVQVNYYPSLNFVEPIRIIEHPTENKLLIIGKDGLGWLVTHQQGATDKTLFFNIQSIMQGKGGVGEGGISDLAFHPEYGQSGSPNSQYVYISYRWAPPGATGAGGFYEDHLVDGYNRLSRFTVINNQVNLASEQVLINQFDRQQWHIGGDLFFGDDGFLYVSLGDEGFCCSREYSTQRLDGGLWSGIIRIDVDQDSSRSHPIRRQPSHLEVNPQNNGPEWPLSYSQNYYIPNDNPFLDPNGGVLEEFYAIGMRHPFTIHRDDATGEIWAADVGESAMEEIDLVYKGGNYQWGYAEGTLQDGPINKPGQVIGTEYTPVWAYPHSQGQAVLGAGVYRGAKFPELFGKYLFSDFISGALWTATKNGDGHDIEQIGSVTAGFPDGVNGYLMDSKGDVLLAKTSGGQDPNGEIQVLARANDVVPAPEPPDALSQTGAFLNLQNLTPHAGCIPYDLNVPFWSDDAAKFRWMCVPNDGTHNTGAEQIGFSEDGDWSFPEGSVLIKHFELPTNTANPNTTVRLETRFLVHGSDGYYGVTYRWDAGGNNAYLITGAETQNYTVQTPEGPRQQTWHFPGRGECMTCHNRTAGGVLGPKTRQLNTDTFYPLTGNTANQLETLDALGMFNPGLPGNINQFLNSVLTSTPTDALDANLSDRARSYLDANCGYCHRPGGVRANFDARLTTPLSAQNIILGEPSENLGIAGAAVLVPGNLTRSLVYHRANSAGQPHSMPPLAKDLVDIEGMALLAQWIESLGLIELGNDVSEGGVFIDGHHPSLYVNEQDAFVNNDDLDQIHVEQFKFFAQRLGNPITPLVLREDSSNNFTVLAIGDTRTASEYGVGTNVFAFSDSGPVEIALSPGDEIVIGFMDSYPDGTGWGAGSVIPAEANGGGAQDAIWALLPAPLILQTTPFDPNRDTPVVQLNQSILAANNGRALNPYTNLRRSYKFAITFRLPDSAPPPMPTDDPVFVNGSFELPVVTSPLGWNAYSAAGAIPGWTITSGSVELDRTPWPAFDGQQSMDLNGNSTGALQQQVNGFTTGESYQVQLEYGLHPGAQGSATAQISVNGASIGTITAGQGMKVPNYQTASLPFIATALAQTINIESLTGGNTGVVIDNVRITEGGDVTPPPPPPPPPPPGSCSQTSNLAPQGSASQSSTLGGNRFPAGNAIDGNLNNFTHTASNQSSASWAVDFGQNIQMHEVVLFNRSNCCGSRFRDLTVRIFSSSGGLVFESALLNPENVLGSPPQLELDVVALAGNPVLGNRLEVVRQSDPDLSGTAGNGNQDEADVLSLGEVVIQGCVSDAGADSDGDGVPDGQDAFPNDPDESADSDDDGIGDNADPLPNTPNRAPNVSNPGNQSDVQGSNVSLQIAANDLDGDNLAFAASGLPPGLSIDINSGLISGVALSSGTYAVSVIASDLVTTGSVQFSWVVDSGTSGSSMCASGQPNLLVNGSFEDTSNPGYNSVAQMIEDLGILAGNILYLDFHPDSDFPGWFATGGIALQQGGFSEGGTIEVGLTGFLGAVAPDGQVLVEMDANVHNQIVNVTPGQSLDWELAHRGRRGTDSISISIAPVGETNVLANLQSPQGSWTIHSGRYLVPDGVTSVQIAVRPETASDGDIDSSNLLDDVKLCPGDVPPPPPPPSGQCGISSINLALAGDASQSSTLGETRFPAANAIDGNINNFTHTNTGQAPASWEVELGDLMLVEEVVVHNRGNCCGSRLRDISIQVFSDESTVVYQSALLNPENELNSPDEITLDINALLGSGVVGNRIVVTRQSDDDLSGSGGSGNADESDVLSMAEVQVMGCPIP